MVAATRRDTQEVMGYIQKEPPDGCGICVSPKVTAAEFKKRRVAMTDPRTVDFLDARAFSGNDLASWTLDTHGFCMVAAPPPMDFKNRKLLLEEYYPKMAELAKRHTGAEEAYVWTSLLRDENSKTGNSYSRFAHSDAGTESPQMFRLLLQGKFGLTREKAENCEIMMVNIWHPRDHPAYKDPLCLLDATSLSPEEEAVNIRYVQSGGSKAFLGGKDPEAVAKDRKFLEGFWGKPTLAKFPGELPAPSNGAGLVGPTYRPQHRWVFCSDQRPDEHNPLTHVVLVSAGAAPPGCCCEYVLCTGERPCAPAFLCIGERDSSIKQELLMELANPSRDFWEGPPGIEIVEIEIEIVKIEIVEKHLESEDEKHSEESFLLNEATPDAPPAADPLMAG